MLHSLQGDTSNAELLFCTKKSGTTDQYYGAVTDWCDELALQKFGQSFEALRSMAEQSNRNSVPKEVNTVVKAFETDVLASLNRLRDYQEKSEKVSKGMKVSQTRGNIWVLKESQY